MNLRFFGENHKNLLTFTKTLKAAADIPIPAAFTSIFRYSVMIFPSVNEYFLYARVCYPISCIFRSG